MELQVPTVTIDDLRAFHAKHFPHATAPEHFLDTFAPKDADEHYEEEDDGLGYYPDGTKRTITDEQIAIFRHSEIQSILRGRRVRREAGELSEEGEAVDEPPQTVASPASPSTTEPAVKPKPQQWATSSTRTKRKNRRNREKYRLKKRGIKMEREREQKEGRLSPYVGSESDEWDPWHQANGPDAQKQDELDLDY